MRFRAGPVYLSAASAAPGILCCVGFGCVCQLEADRVFQSLPLLLKENLRGKCLLQVEASPLRTRAVFVIFNLSRLRMGRSENSQHTLKGSRTSGAGLGTLRMFKLIFKNTPLKAVMQSHLMDGKLRTRERNHWPEGRELVSRKDGQFQSPKSITCPPRLPTASQESDKWW